MRNKYKGNCNLCGKEVLPGKGRVRTIPYFTTNAQDFTGLRCIPCGTTTKKGLKLTSDRLKSNKKVKQ